MSDNKEVNKTEECKHREIEFDESTGTTICQTCYKTLRPKYSPSGFPTKDRGS